MGAAAIVAAVVGTKKSAAIGGSKRKHVTKGLGGRVLKEQRARLYIIRRCVVMLLCWHE